MKYDQTCVSILNQKEGQFLLFFIRTKFNIRFLYIRFDCKTRKKYGKRIEQGGDPPPHPPMPRTHGELNVFYMAGRLEMAGLYNRIQMLLDCTELQSDLHLYCLSPG